MIRRESKSVAVDAQLLALAHGTPGAPADDAELVGRALRAYVGRAAMGTAREIAGVPEGEALTLAYDELHAARRTGT